MTEKYLSIRLRQDEWKHLNRLDEAMPGLKMEYSAPNSRESSSDPDPRHALPIKVFDVPIGDQDTEVALALLDELGIEHGIHEQLLPQSMDWLYEEDYDDCD